jgi:hypothetical protein
MKTLGEGTRLMVADSLTQQTSSSINQA